MARKSRKETVVLPAPEMDTTYNAEPAQYILSIGFRPEDTTSEQMLNCIRNLIDIGIIAKDDASS